MDSRQTVLVFPGGSHEVMKHSSLPRYSLLWKQRLGFASVAIKHGYPIIPVASIGIEDSVDIVFDIPLGFYRKDQSFPAPGPIWPHRLQRIYYWVGEPIPTSKYNFEWQNDGFCRELRDDTKAAVEHGIRLLQDKQAQDPNRYRFPVLTRMASSLQSFFSPRLFKNDLPDDESEQGSVTEHENRAVREKKTS
jgi:1-acyl-sn-glycerol-3-phosphate acyltransferase